MKGAGKTRGHARSICPPFARCGQAEAEAGKLIKYNAKTACYELRASGQKAGKIEPILPLPAPSLTLVGRAEGKTGKRGPAQFVLTWPLASWAQPIMPISPVYLRTPAPSAVMRT